MKRKVKVVDGSTLKVQGIGNILQAWNGKNQIKIELKDVFYVPKLNVNLLSLSTVSDKGFIIHSDKLDCK